MRHKASSKAKDVYGERSQAFEITFVAFDGAVGQVAGGERDLAQSDLGGGDGLWDWGGRCARDDEHCE